MSGLTKTDIEAHLKEGTFVETPAVKACVKLLETNSLLVLTGAAGTGKSRNSLEILLQFQVNNPEFKTVKLTDLHDFTDVVTEEEKLVILFEDIFGRTNTRFAENTDVQIIDRIHACTIKGNIKVILTVRDTIRMSCQWILNSHKIFHGKCEVDLSSETFKMKRNEKESLLLKYFNAHNFQLVEYNDPENYFEEVILDPKISATINRVTFHDIVESEPLLGFPEACSLFTGNRKLTRLGLSFYKHPSKYLFEEIEKLRKNGKNNEQDRMSYVTLVYILLNEDVLDPDDIELNICIEILESCYGISNKKLPVCHIIDAASEMIGRYLIFHCDDGTYHLQHQTIFESILISYNRVDPGLILSRLSFDFIREMVRLQRYEPREGEIVMKITKKYYPMLAIRIIDIIQSDYFNKSLSLNFQLLCKSLIIKENDEVFLKHLIEKAHHAYFQPEYDLQTFVTYGGECKLCQLYIPALLLERITQQNKMNESITLLADHITVMLNSKSEEDIEFVCKSSLLDAFLNVCDLENNENILDNMWVSVRSLDMSEVTEYIRSSINRVCSRCPMTTMRWMLNNIDQRIFDMNQLMKRACEFKRLDIVQFLCETINHNQLDFTSAFVAAINNVWNDTDESVSKWLINNIDLQLFDMKQITSEVLEVGCEKDLHFLLQHVDNCMLDIKAVFNKLYKKGRRSIESLLKWIGINVEKEKMNTLEMSNQACLTEDCEVVKYLINNIDLGSLDVMSVLIYSMISKWQDDNKYLIQWICLNVDLKQINIINVIDKAFEEEKYDELKILLKNIRENHSTVLRNACKNKQLELIKILLSVADHDKLNMREAVRSVCVLEKMELLEFFLYNVDHSLYDAHHVLKESCRYGWVHIVKWLLDNIQHASLDIHTAMNTVLHREFVGPDNALIGLLLQYPIHDKVDVTKIIKECCWWGLLNLVQIVCEKNDHQKLDMKEAMNTACSRSHFDLVDWMLANIKNNLFDLPTAFDKAIHADIDDLNASLILLLKDYTDHKLIDMAHLLMIGCKQCWYDIVNWVLGNADHSVLDVDKAMNSVYIKWMFDEPYNDDIEINCRRVKYEPLIKMILEKVNHNLLDMKKVFNQACHYASLDVVILVLENTDHKKIDVKKALDILYISWMYDDTFDELRINERRDKYEPLIKLMVEKVNFDSLDLNKVLNQACQYGSFDIVKIVLENTDHERLDVNEAMKKAYDSWMYVEKKRIDGRNRYEPVMKLILEKVNHNSLYSQKILIQACTIGSLDVLTLVLENNDHNKLDVKAAMNILHDELNDFKYYYAIMKYHYHEEKRNRKKSLIKLILDKVNHESLDMKIALNLSCCYGLLDCVTFVLQNTDHKMLDVKRATNILYDESERTYCNSTIEEIEDRRDQYDQLLKLFIEKVKHDSLDLQMLLILACRYCSLDVVTLLLEKTDHKMLDVEEAMNIICDYDEEEISNRRDRYEQLIKLILNKVNHDSLNLQQVFDRVCRYCSLDVVTLLLEKTDHKMLDVKKAMNIICDEWDSVDRLFHYDDDEISDRTDKCEQLIKLILDRVNHDSLNLQQVFDRACRYCSLDVVTLLLEKTDHKMLDVKKAMNIICDEWDSVARLFHYDDDEISDRRDKCEQLIKLILDRVNHDSLNLQNILNPACRNCSLDVVTLLLEKTDHKMLDVKKAMNIICDEWDSVDRLFHYDDDEISDRRDKCEQLIKLILDRVNHDSLNLQQVFDRACRYCSLDVVTLLLEKTDHKMLDVKKAMNIICDEWDSVDRLFHYDDDEISDRTDKCEQLIKLILDRVNHDSLNLQQVFDRACRYCSLDVVTLLLEKTDHKMLDVKKAMNIICDEWDSVARLFHYDDNEISDRRDKCEQLIKLILDRVNHDSLNLQNILNPACRNCSLDVVTLLLEKTDHKMLDVKKAMNIICDEWDSVDRLFHYDDDEISDRRDKCEQLIKLILDRVNHDSLNLQNILNPACRNCSLDVVTLLLEKTDPKMLDVKQAVNIMYDKCDDAKNSDEKDIFERLIKLILEKVNHDSLDLLIILNLACRFDSLNVVTFLFEKTNLKTLHVKQAVNIICDEWDFYEDEENRDKRDKNEPIIKLILETVNHYSLDMNISLNLACRYCLLDFVTLLLEITDHKLLDVKNAMKILNDTMYYRYDEGKRERFKSVVKLFLEKVSHSLLDLPYILKQACHNRSLDMITLLLENTDHKKLDVNGAMNVVTGNEVKDMIKLFLENVNHSLFDINEVLNKTWNDRSLDTVMWLLMNNDHALFDLKDVMRKACESGESRIITYLVENCDNTLLDITGAITRVLENNILNDSNKEIIKYLFRKVSKDLIDDKMLQVVPYKLALPFIVTLCFKRFDNYTQGFSKVILHKSAMEHGYMSMVRSNGGLTLIQKLVTDINSENFDIKDIMNKACSFGCFDTVTWLLDNEDHSRFDLKMAMCNTFNSSCLCKEELMQLLLQKCVVDELDMEINMNEACKQGMLKIVTWLIENIDHRLFDLNTAISHLFHHFTDRNQDIFKLLIANVSYKLFDFGIVIEQAFWLDHTEILIWLLQAKYHSLLDVKYVMNEACRVGNLRIIKHVCGTMGKEYFNSRSAINKACRSSKTNSVRVVKWLWENLQHTTVDMESAMNNACRYDNIAVVEWLWTNLERKLFNVKNAWNNACYNCNKKLLSYLLKNMEVNMLDKSKALVHACRNYREGDQIISLLFKTPNMISPENCKIVFKEACVQCNIKVVKWLLAHTDIKPLEYKDTLIDTIKATTNKSNKKDKTDHKNLVCFMLNHRMIKKLDRHELSVVVEALSSIGKIDMVKQLWYKTANNMFNMRDIVNTACKSGKLEIVDWLLQKIALENLDVQTVMVESCGYGWLKIVKLLLSKCEMKILDISTAMDEACSYGRYDIVNFLLKNVDIKTFNTKLVLEKASGYGWKDIINWSFDNSNDTSFDLNECMLEAFLQGRLEIIEIFFSKYGAKQFDVDILVDKSCSNCGNAGVMKFLIENFELKQKHLDIIIKSACKYSWTEIVSSILDRCKHDKNIMEEAMKNVCNSGENEIVEIFLDKIDISFLGVKTNMVIPCQKGWDEIVSLLLERVDHSLFDLTVAMNEACRCGEADIVELLIQKVNHKHFNFDTAIEEACKSHLNENLVLTLLKYINCSTSDIDGMSKKAREYGWRKVGSRLKRMSYNEN